MTAYFAGGCFWGMEELFRKLPGVANTEVGYTGGRNEDPTYENHPGHAETLQITYDPRQISYKELLDYFFRVHNPTTLNRQGGDVGDSYRSAIFYESEGEQKAAEDFIQTVNQSGRWPNPVTTAIEPLTKFWRAEEYHQDYLKKHPGGYTCHAVRFGSYAAKKPETLYQCPECGFHYRKKKWAEKCEVWCREHKSCNIEITAHAEKNKK